MKKIFSLLVFTAFLSSASAQIRGDWQGRGSFHVYTNLSADYHINSADVTPKRLRDRGVLVAPDMIGSRIGFDMVRITRHRQYISLGFDFRFEPQRLEINYVARDMGFTGSDYEYHNTKKFTNKTIETKGKLGHSIPISKAGALDIAAGITIRIPLNGRTDTATLLFADLNNTGYKDPIIFQQTGWGNNSSRAISGSGYHINLMGQFQVAYRFLQPAIFGDRSLRVGADVGCTVPTGEYNNRTEVQIYGPGRSNVQTYTYQDYHLGIGLFVGVEL